MLTFEQMLIRFAIALVLGAILGLERELVGKQAAGIRTTILVTSGASIFAMIALMLPYITAATLGATPDATALNSAFSVIANIVVGVGFLGGGLIIKLNDQAHGVTTAALIWTAAAIGTLVGIGLTQFAAAAAILLALILYVIRKLNISKSLAERASEGMAK
jgi:putative Mg2+ transporter-C (MgtC) family protein